MDKKLIDRGDFYEIEDYEPTVNRDEFGNIISIINCPYIPKFLFDGDDKGSTGVKVKWSLPGEARNSFN